MLQLSTEPGGCQQRLIRAALALTDWIFSSQNLAGRFNFFFLLHYFLLDRGKNNLRSDVLAKLYSPLTHPDSIQALGVNKRFPKFAAVLLPPTYTRPSSLNNSKENVEESRVCFLLEVVCLICVLNIHLTSS